MDYKLNYVSVFTWMERTFGIAPFHTNENSMGQKKKEKSI